MNKETLIIDSHAHLNFKAFEKDLEEVMERTLDNDIWVVNVGSQYETSFKAVEIALKHQEGVYASVGLHPIHTYGESKEVFDYQRYRELASSKKVVAIGETGLDYFFRFKKDKEQSKENQKKVFLEHLRLAQEMNLPVIIHCRMAHSDLIEILNDLSVRGVIHCFTGNYQEAQQYLNKGLFLGFTGIIFKLDMERVIKEAPLDRILIETDCPYLSPPGREERNEPLYIKDTAQEIARIKKISYQQVVEATTGNARKMFNI
jgi:TatD DNase family protein